MSSLIADAQAAVTAIFLGDGYSGKTTLIKRLTHLRDGNQLPPLVEESLPYQPTVGAEVSSTSLRFNRTETSVSMWDVPGSERFNAGVPSPKIGSDVCVLVVDSTNADALNHLDSWHDEYVRNCADSIALPAFIVALMKVDVPQERRKIFTDDVARWCSREHVDPMLWPKDITGAAQPVPPVVECSALTGDGLSLLLEHIAHRGTLRQKITERSSKIALESTVEAFSKISAGVWTGVVVGDVRPPPAEMFGETPLQWTTSPSGDLLVWNAPNPMVPGNGGCCRNAHVAMITIPVNDNVQVQTIRLWQEIVLREGCLRDPRSIAWVVIGVHTPSRTVDVSLALSTFCTNHDMMLVELPVASFAADIDNAWMRVIEYMRRYTLELLVERSQQQSFQSVPCPNPPCSWVGRIVDVEKHLVTCGYVSVRCHWDRCTHQCIRSQREEHERFCSHRPPSCHFCEQPYSGALYEHLVQCKERAAFERTHAPCPMASIGCSSTLIQRGDMQKHIDEERVQHIQLLSAAYATLQKDMLEQERNHHNEVEKLKNTFASQVESLRGEILLARAMSDSHHDAMRDVAAEFRLVWEELNALKQQKDR